VEIMTTKLMASDAERTALQTELSALRASRIGDSEGLTSRIQELSEQLADSERRLQESVEREETASRQLAVRSGEAETSRLESEKNSQLLASLRGEMQHVTAERDRLGDETRSLREALLERDASLTVQAAKRLSALDEWRAGESRREIVSGRMDTEELRVLTERQQRDLESLVRELSSANETITSCRAEVDKLKAKLAQADESSRGGKSRLLELETETRALQSAQRDLLDRAVSAGEERDEYRAMFERVDADMRSYLRSAEQHGVKQSISRDSPRRGRSSSRRAYSSGRYLDSMSTDSESPSPDPGEEQGDAAPSARQSFSSPLSRNMPGRFSLSVLEQKAAEIMAHMLTEELQRTGTRGAMSEFTTSAGLKEACSIVALRLLHTSVGVVRDEELDRVDDSHAHCGDANATPGN
jgi:predicted  nucleic acid-binding Zn-ribbon protein